MLIRPQWATTLREKSVSDLWQYTEDKQASPLNQAVYMYFSFEFPHWVTSSIKDLNKNKSEVAYFVLQSVRIDNAS